MLFFYRKRKLCQIILYHFYKLQNISIIFAVEAYKTYDSGDGINELPPNIELVSFIIINAL